MEFDRLGIFRQLHRYWSLSTNISAIKRRNAYETRKIQNPASADVYMLANVVAWCLFLIRLSAHAGTGLTNQANYSHSVQQLPYCFISNNKLNKIIFLRTALTEYQSGAYRKGKGSTMHRAPKSPNNVASTFFNTVAYICPWKTFKIKNLLLAPGAI